MKLLPTSLTMAAALLLAQGAFAATISYDVNLSGAAESPSNASAGTGFGTVVFNTTAHSMQVDLTFSGLTGNVTASHIHCCTATPGIANAGVATTTPTFTGFPSGVTSGTYSHLFDLTVTTSFNGAFVSANGGTAASAEAALLAGAAAGRAYWNVHTNAFPGGEIRGFLTASATPEPASVLLAAGALLGLGLVRRRSKV